MDLDWTHGCLAEGLRCYHARVFFAAHEHWESAWLASQEPEKTFLQALTQVAASFHHFRRGSPEGATLLPRAALRRLELYPDSIAGVSVMLLSEGIREWLEEKPTNTRTCLSDNKTEHLTTQLGKGRLIPKKACTHLNTNRRAGQCSRSFRSRKAPNVKRARFQQKLLRKSANLRKIRWVFLFCAWSQSFMPTLQGVLERNVHVAAPELYEKLDRNRVRCYSCRNCPQCLRGILIQLKTNGGYPHGQSQTTDSLS
jgi:hypothetical protein